MYERILVTLDGSELSEAAIGAAARLASGTETRVNVLTVAEPPKPGVKRVERAEIVPEPAVYGAVLKPEFEQAEADTGAQARISSECEDYLRKAASPLSAAGLNVEPSVRFSNKPAEAIVDAASDWNADAIVMATHGRSGLGEAIFGSVAREVLRNGSRPVVLVTPS